MNSNICYKIILFILLIIIASILYTNFYKETYTTEHTLIEKEPELFEKEPELYENDNLSSNKWACLIEQSKKEPFLGKLYDVMSEDCKLCKKSPDLDENGKRVCPYSDLLKYDQETDSCICKYKNPDTNSYNPIPFKINGNKPNYWRCPAVPDDIDEDGNIIKRGKCPIYVNNNDC